MQTYYVYELLDPRSGLCFYVGKGTDDRAFWHEKKVQNGGGTGNPHKDSLIKQILSESYRVTVKIVRDDLSSDDAFALEAVLIEQYGLRSEGGALTNLKPGGKGGCPKWSEERKAYFSELMKGNTINTGRVQSSEEKEKRRQSLVRAYESGKRIPTDKQLVALNQTGRKRSEETKEKIRQNALNRTAEHKDKIAKALRGKKPHNKGQFGAVAQSLESNKRRSASNKGRTPWNKGKPGKVKMSEEAIQKRIASRRASAEQRGKW